MMKAAAEEKPLPQRNQGEVGPGATHSVTGKGVASKTIDIDFLFLNLSTCTRCKGTNEMLDEALAIVHPVLEATGIKVNVRKTQIQTLEQARSLRFVSSPTIRVNDRDIALEQKESRCDSCESACGEPVDCRVWVYQGQESTVAPVGMIVEAILRGIYAGEQLPAPMPYQDVPDNLKRVFAARASGVVGRTC